MRQCPFHLFTSVSSFFSFLFTLFISINVSTLQYNVFQVDKVLDSRSEGLGFDSLYVMRVKCRANFVFHTAFVNPAVIGTWCTDPSLDQ